MGTDTSPKQKQQHLIGERFRPVGSRAAFQWRISRRGFLVNGIAMPLALAVDVKTLWADQAGSDDLRFIEDVHGVTVIDASDPPPAPPRIWRLHRIAFGPTTQFKLRTLLAGSKKGYEIEISGVRFGPRKARSHWIVFQREGNGWSVRMRSNLWSGDKNEITSSDVPFKVLADARPRTQVPSANETQPCPQAQRWFIFKLSATDIDEALTSIVEGYVRAFGTVRLEFDADAVWHLLPRGSGRLTVAPFGFQLTDLALAWCEATTGNAEACLSGLPRNAHPLGTIEGDAELAVLQPKRIQGEHDNSQFPDPVFCASGSIKPDAIRVRCRGDSSFALTLQYDGSNAAAKKAPSLSYAFLRQDWANHVLGFSEIKSIRGVWNLTAHNGQKIMLGDVRVSEASFRTWHGPEAGKTTYITEFSGSAPNEPFLVQTRIGRLKISGFQGHDSFSTAPTNSVQIKVQHPSIVVPVGEPAIATLVSIPFLLHESDLALAGSDFSELTFESTAVVGFWRPAKAAMATALPLRITYGWARMRL